VRRNLSVESLLAALPEQPEFDLIRQAILRASVASAEPDTAGEASYSTLDRRSIPAAQIPHILAEAELEGRRRAKRLSDSVALALSAVAEGQTAPKLKLLAAAGEEDEQAERWRDAVAHYSMAAHLGRLGNDMELRALALRRLGRAWLNCGEFERAITEYRESLAVATAAGIAEGEITAATGLGNTSSLQGRWSDAARWYHQALDRCTDIFARERGQLCVNLSMTSREQHRLDEARSWLNNARAGWGSLLDTDQSGWFNNDGLLQLALGDISTAEMSFMQALKLAQTLFDRTMILDNLADVSARQNRLELAEARAREAEALALTLGSPRVLAEVYMRLGMLCRQRADTNGVVFFEKALNLARHRNYSLLFGKTLREYGRFRMMLSDPRSANILFTEALTIFSELGAVELAEATRSEM
jgi:tetratricopeptide (TPR) repeat protein